VLPSSIRFVGFTPFTSIQSLKLNIPDNFRPLWGGIEQSFVGLERINPRWLRSITFHFSLFQRSYLENELSYFLQQYISILRKASEGNLAHMKKKLEFTIGDAEQVVVMDSNQLDNLEKLLGDLHAAFGEADLWVEGVLCYKSGVQIGKPTLLKHLDL
jgi:hypothetical protein